MTELEKLQKENDRLLEEIIEKDKEILKLIKEINDDLRIATKSY